MATNKIQIDEGSTTNLATNSFTEDAVTKHVSRSVLNNSSGTEIGTTSNPIQIGDAGGSITVDGTVAVSGTVTVGSHAVTNAGTFAVQAAQSGTWTVQPGNTANTTAWKVDGSAVTQPVSLASVPSHAVTNAGTFATQESGAALTALQLIDNIVLAEDAAHVSGDPGVQALAVRKDTGASIAGSDGDYSPLQVDSSGNLRVNIAAGSSSGTEYTEDAASAADPAGGMLIARRRDTLSGTEVSADGDNIAVNATAKGEIYVKQTDAVPATQSGTWNITNVSGTVSLPTGASTEATLSTLNGKVTACNTGAVVISSGTVSTITNVVHVDDNAGSLTVDAPVGTPVFVRLSDGTSAITTLPVSLASVPSHAVTNAGTFAVQESGGALTALQLIDDIVLAEDAAHSSGDKGVMALAVRKDTPTQLAGADGDYTPFISDSNGRIRVSHGAHNKTTVSTGGTASTSGNNTLVAAGSAKLKVYAFSLSTTSTTAVTCIFQSGTGGSELWRVVLQAPSSVSTGANLVVAPPAWIFQTASATLLNLNLSAAVTVHWSVAYFDEA